jgi:Leucine-rich repeat (LRR) protein
MKRNKLCVFTVSLVFMMAFSAYAQKTKPQKSAKKPAAQKVEKTGQATAGTSQNEEKVKDLVAFFQLLLNTLGSNSTSARDKEIVITESYAKVFRDSKVQVEDDLADVRATITNKDVVAYLKDVDFFFKDVKFELLIEDIKEGVNANGQVYYKVSLRRTLTGTTASGQPINNTIPRYIEINYDPEAEDLKIASIYTNEFDEKEALTTWWTQLSFEWQTIFKTKLNVTDTVDLNDIKDMIALSELDLGGNKYVQSIEPLGQLINLRLLNLSETNVEDLTPIRNLTELVELDLSRSKIFDLSPLKYANKLSRLNINHTEIRSIAVLEKMPSIQNLEMQHAHVIDFAPLSFLTALQNLDLRGTQIPTLAPIQHLPSVVELNISKTRIQDLNPLKGFATLTTLNIDSTLTRDIRALSGLEKLEVLYANYTFISDLSPLQKLPSLKRVYCDQTPVNKAVADAFMSATPHVLVIFDSKDLQAWWNTLSADWRRILTTAAKIRVIPGKEELARVTNIDSVNVSNTRSITTLEPLRKLLKVQVVLAQNSGITELTALQDHRAIRHLDISDTEVRDVTPLSKLAALKVLRADRSKIEKLDPLFTLKQLQELYVDRTAIHDITAREFLDKNPDCLLVYKTIHLDRWWKNLPGGWKEVFRLQMGVDTTVTRESLHKLVEQEVFNFKEAHVRDLSALSEFVRLSELHFSGTGISEIPDMETLRSLKKLQATNSPLQRIGAVSLLSQLEFLDISNTPVDELKGLEGLENLKTLICAGTQVKKLDPLKSLHQLESMDCSNTNVSKLDPVMYLSLRTLKCYNTKISSREIEQFTENNPECRVVYYR